MNELKLNMEKGECWWGGDIARGGLMPLTRKNFCSFDLEHITTENQATSLFVSNKGRYVWCEHGFTLRTAFGRMSFRSEKSQIVCKEGLGSLRDAFLHAAKQFFPANGKHPADKLFSKLQYSTWVALGNNQTQDSILNYAENILKKGMPAGTLIIDDGWQKAFGEWVFDEKKFPNPKLLLDRLNRMGFEVMLWISPFVSTAAAEFETLKRSSMLIRNRKGGISTARRQKGAGSVLDFSNPETTEWYRGKIFALFQTYPNIVGVKQDAGDPKYYFDDDITYGGVLPNEQAKLWTQFAEKFEYNELRVSVNGGGKGVMQRQMDKTHTWGNRFGLRSLIPCAMLQGVMGYPFLCADMVGGGQIRSFRGIWRRKISTELLIRWAEVSALMPAMQFSYPVWNITRKSAAQRVIDAAEIHLRFTPYLLECVNRAAETGEPVIRVMEYDFPDDGLQDIVDQFMVGDRYLVAPVTKARAKKKIVSLPTGTWKHLNNDQVYRGGQDIEVNAPLGILPIFERL